jgi:hypothetical protein
VIQILPALFYWKIVRPRVDEQVLLFLLVLFAIGGSAAGIYVGIDSMINDIKQQHNPLDGLFSFHKK